MQRGKKKGAGEANETSLTMLMRAVIEARNRLERARGRLRSIEEKLRGADRGKYERQRNEALGEYIAAVSKARQARTQLLKQLRERAA